MAVDDDQQVRLAFEDALNCADDVQLLLWAEAGGNATAAYTVIATAIGYPLSNHLGNRQAFCSMIGTRWAGLRYLTNGPTPDCPRGNFYTWTL
jgi:hypothetical protein